jgi:hypothetical protein
MKFFILIYFFIFSLGLQAQSQERIRVKKVKWEVSISAKDSIFWIRMDNPVSIKVKGGTNYVIDLKGGTLVKKGESYFVKVTEEGAATISVIEKLANKKMRIVFTKLFPVKRIPRPLFFVCGVKADSVIDKQQIIEENVITAFHPFYKKNIQVLGFDLVLPGGGNTVNLTSTNNHFTPEMKKRIYSLKSGTILYFENVYFQLPDGEIEKLNSFQLFVSETNKYKVGYRVMGL